MRMMDEEDFRKTVKVSTVNENIEEKSSEEEVSDGQLIDISRIEEQLQHVKDKYKDINQKYHTIYENWKKTEM